MNTHTPAGGHEAGFCESRAMNPHIFTSTCPCNLLRRSLKESFGCLMRDGTFFEKKMILYLRCNANWPSREKSNGETIEAKTFQNRGRPAERDGQETWKETQNRSKKKRSQRH